MMIRWLSVVSLIALFTLPVSVAAEPGEVENLPEDRQAGDVAVYGGVASYFYDYQELSLFPTVNGGIIAHRGPHLALTGQLGVGVDSGALGVRVLGGGRFQIPVGRSTFGLGAEIGAVGFRAVSQPSHGPETVGYEGIPLMSVTVSYDYLWQGGLFVGVVASADAPVPLPEFRFMPRTAVSVGYEF